MSINFAKTFRKQYDKADHKIKSTFDARLELFVINPFHPQLNNHVLTGKFNGYRSINITGDWRAIYSENRGIVIFKLLGTHSQLYK